MATRLERVVLDLEDRFTDPMARATAQTALARKELKSLNGDSVKAGSSVRSVSNDVDSLGQSSKKAGPEIDRLSGRLRLFTDLAATLGPGLIPLGASTIPVLSGLAAEAGAAAAGMGVTLLAVKGLGDGIKALNTYELDPTAENLAAVREEFHKLGPAGANFVVFLDDLEPKLRKLQVAARNGLLPGAQQGIEELLEELPNVRGFVSDIAGTLGQLAADAGSDLTGEGWRDFFNYLHTDAAPTLDQLSRTVGNFAQGLGSLLAAFAPASRDFTGGLLEMSQAFADWSANLQGSEGLAHFLDYVSESGPQALDLLGSVADALIQVAQAGAPIGAEVLPILTDLVDIVATIAGSDIGTPLLAGYAAMTLFTRASALGQKAMDKTWGGQRVGQIRSAGSALLYVTSAQERATLSATALARAEAERQATVRSGFGTMLKGAGLVAGFALASSGAADKIGLSNTMNLALMGTLAGPWGAAVGGAIGLIRDFQSSAYDAGEATKSWDKLLGSGSTNLSDYAAVIANAQGQLDQMSEMVPTSLGDALKKSLNPQNIKMNFAALFGDLDDTDLFKQSDEVASLNSQYEDLIYTARIVGHVIGEIGTGQAGTMDQLTASLSAVKPAMDALGISTEDMVAAMRDGSILTMLDRIKDWTVHADSAAGRAEALGAAVAGLDDDMKSTAQSATDLKNALDAVLGPQLDLSAATDAWTTGLRHLNDDLAEHGRSLKGNTDAAIKNRAAVRDRVGDMLGVLNAEAAAGASSERLSKLMGRQRQALIDAGHAAGLSKGEMREYLNTLGLTPKTIETIIKANTASAEAGISRVQAKLNALRDKTLHITTIENHVSAPTPGNPSADPVTGSGAGKGDKGGKDPQRQTSAGSSQPFDFGAVRQRRYQTAAHRTLSLNRSAGAGAGAGGRGLSGDLVVSGRLNTPWGPAQVEGIARAVAREEIDADSEFDRDHRGGRS